MKSKYFSSRSNVLSSHIPFLPNTDISELAPAYPFLPQSITEVDANILMSDDTNVLSACVKLSQLLEYIMINDYDNTDIVPIPYTILPTISKTVSYLHIFFELFININF